MFLRINKHALLCFQDLGSPDKKVAKAGKEAGDDVDDLGSGADAAAGVI
jgi:hypothetical protein